MIYLFDLLFVSILFFRFFPFIHTLSNSNTTNLIIAEDSVLAPYTVKENLFDFDNPNTLGLEKVNNTETFTVFSPSSRKDNAYNHGVVLFPFKGYLYAQWQSSKRDEDELGTNVLYSRSKDGKIWSNPKPLTESYENQVTTSGGWWGWGDSLTAYINVWNQDKDVPRGGYAAYKRSQDGINWSRMKRVVDINSNFVNGIIEQDLHQLPDGRILTAFHEQPGLQVAPYFTDDPYGIKGWTKGEMQNLRYKTEISRELEPSSFYRSDGTVVMIFRDQAGSFKQLASISLDDCLTWSSPVLTEMPDSRSKQSAGNLPSGTVFLVNNPSGNKQRYPLAITLSKDGYLFDRSYLIRGGDEIPDIKFEGKYKRRGFSYPKSCVWNDFLYIGYSANKEDVQITRIPLAELE